jgi:hypothetical protein
MSIFATAGDFVPKADVSQVSVGKMSMEEYYASAKMRLPAHYDFVEVEYEKEVTEQRSGEPLILDNIDLNRLNEHIKWNVCKQAIRKNTKVSTSTLKSVRKIGHLFVQVKESIPLIACTFGMGYVVNIQSGMKIVQPADGSAAFDPVMNELQPVKGSITYAGSAWVYLRKTNGEFHDVYVPRDGKDFQVVGYDLADLNAKFGKYKVEQAYWSLVYEIRAALASSKFLNESAVEAMAKKLGIKVNAKKILHQETIAAGYRPEYVWYLDGLKQGDAFYGSGGNFFFEFKGCWVWEDPQDGHATYVMRKGMPIGELSAKATGTPRTVIMAQPELLGYVGRVIHPSRDPEDEELNKRLMEGWKERLNKVMEGLI